jgi:hypothetical protein
MKSPKTTVTLEDLLRFKRAEQPPAEFWNEFERELRAKQLAAIVEPRPWWAPFIRVGARLGHLQLPVGAAAILAVTLVSIRQYEGTEPISMEPPALSLQQPIPESMLQVRSISDLSYTEDLPVATDPNEYSEAMPVEENALSVVAAVEPAPRSPQSNDAPTAEREPSPSARYIAANLAAAQEADPSLMDDVFGHSFRHAQSRQPIRDPLAQVSSPGESRRSRLLATALPVNAGAAELGGGTNERFARTLTEQRLYDTISRVGLRGDRVAIKF